MPPGKIVKAQKSRWFNTTIGEFVEAVYEAAMEEYMDEIMARRIAMQMLVRKLRLQHKLSDMVSAEKPEQPQKKAYLRSELNKRRQKPK
jgi:hypothetical protein